MTRTAVLLLLAAAGVLTAADPDEIGQARNLYYAGIYGDKSAGAKADESFTKLYSRYPENALIKVYYGSLRLLEAQHTWALWKKNSLSKQGIQLMDSAVGAAPKSLEVLFVRGATERELPGFFGRKQQAQDDIKKVAESIEASPSSELEPRLAAAALYDYGLDRQATGDKATAIRAWQAAVKTDAGSHAGKLAAEKLKALP